MQTFNNIVMSLEPWVSSVPIWVWISALAVCVITWVTLRNRRRLRRLQGEVDRVRNEMRAMTTAAVGVGSRVRELERRQRHGKDQPAAQAKKINSQKEKPAEMKQPNVVAMRPVVEDYSSHPYDYAIQLARHGASVRDIMQQSCISQHEANLIYMLHTASKAG
jgi:hypothetical protein